MEMLAQLMLMAYRGSVFFPHASATSSSLMCYILLLFERNSLTRGIVFTRSDPGQSSAAPDLRALSGVSRQEIASQRCVRISVANALISWRKWRRFGCGCL